MIRIGVYGSLIRQLFENKKVGGLPDECPPLQIRSNIFADAKYIYWVGNAKIMWLCDFYIRMTIDFRIISDQEVSKCITEKNGNYSADPRCVSLVT